MQRKQSDVLPIIGVLGFLSFFLGIMVVSKAIYAAPPSGSDSHFAMKAAQGGMAEVKMGQLAQSKGNSEGVKAFGKMMVDDHTKANEQLQQVASKENVTLPSEVDHADQMNYQRLSQLSGPDFDKMYIQLMVKDHQTDVAEFQKEAKDGKDEGIKNFAAQTLPTLQEHLQKARELERTIGTSAANSNSKM